MLINRHSIRALIVTAVALLALPACQREEASKTATPPDVLVTAAATRDVPVYREWIGTLDGSENAEIRARVMGYLMKRDYQEGSLVKKGDLLFEIDPRPFEAALAEAKSQLEQAKATQVASQADAERSKTMFEKRAISEKEYINKTQLNESNMAKTAALQANVDQAQLNLDFCRITSPVDGIAGIAQAQVGDLVGTGSNTVLTSVSTLDPIKGLFPMSEADYLIASQRLQEAISIPLEKRPRTIELLLADGSVFPHKACLLSVNRQVNASSGTILMTTLAPNPGNVLRPGFFARARAVAKVLKDAVVVPQRAVSEVQGSYQIAIVGPDGKAEIRPVQVGPRTGTDWVITSGLKPGDKIIVEGIQKVKAGMPVTAKPWAPPPSEKPAAETKSNAQPESK